MVDEELLRISNRLMGYLLRISKLLIGIILNEEHQTTQGTPHPSNYRINAIICHLLTLEKANKGGVTVRCGGVSLRFR